MRDPDPDGRYAAGAAGAAAERRFGLTAEDVLDVEEEDEEAVEGEGMLVSLRDAAGVVPDLLMRIGAATSVARVRGAAAREVRRRGVLGKGRD